MRPAEAEVQVRVIRGEPVAPPPPRSVERFLAEHPIFSVLSPEDRGWLASRVQFVDLEPGQPLIEQGERSPYLFVLLSGRAGVMRDHDGTLLPLAKLETGDLCAEVSMLSRCPAIATARASSRSVALQISDQDFAILSAREPRIAELVKALACTRIEELRSLAEETVYCREGRTALV